ncbi:MAG: hypothetical protein ACYDCO_01850 [Armatimonadota bacterium]
MTRKAVLFFDTSKTGAGCLLKESRPLPELVDLGRVRYGTDEGDEVLLCLFAKAKALRAEGWTVEVSAEEPQGYDPKFQSGRAMANHHIGILQDYARRNGLTWGGVYAPATAKATLANNGRASKEHMVQAANTLFGAQIEAVYGRKLIYTGDSRTCDEHCADALGGALAAVWGKPYIVRKTGGRAAKAVANRQAKKAPAQTALF